MPPSPPADVAPSAPSDMAPSGASDMARSALSAGSPSDPSDGDSGYVTGDRSAGHRIVRAGGSQSADEASDEKPAASVNSEGESSEESESEAEGMCV